MELVNFTDEQIVYDLHIDGLEAMKLEKKKNKKKAEDPVGQMWASAIAGLSDQQSQAAGKHRQATKKAPAKVKYVKPDVDDRGHADSASDIPSSRPSDSGEDSPRGGADEASSGVGPPPAVASSSVVPKAPPPSGLPPPTSPLLAPPAVLAPPLPSPDIGVGPIDHDDLPLSVLLDHDDLPLSVLLDIAYSGGASSASGAGASSSRAPADGSGGAAVDLDEAVAPADVSRRGRGWGHGGRGVPHRVWDADIRADGLAKMKYEESTFQITAHCNLPSHGRLCRLRRSVLPGKNLAQGRPGGFLLAWLKCAGEYPSQAAHQAMGQKAVVRIQPNLSFDTRALCRAWSESQAAMKAALEELEMKKAEAENEEPEGWA